MFTLPKLSMPHDIYLMRHGETEWNKELRMQGLMDSALTDLGQTQAKRQAHTLRRLRASLGDHALWASTLGRAQQTARLAFDGEPFQTDARLVDVHFGCWEGLTLSEREIRDPDIFSNFDTDFERHTNTPKGERLPELTNRLVAFLNTLHAPAIIVSHQIPLIVMRALLTGEGTALHTGFAPVQGSVLQVSNATAIAHI